jgi:hypothetical protein
MRRRAGRGAPVLRVAESAGAGIAGAAIGALATWPVGFAPAGAVVGGLNGAISGWLGVYEWQRTRGVSAFVLDSSWALLTTGAGVMIHGLNVVGRGAGYAPELSVRANRHVYRRGFRFRKGFAMTWGNVMNGAGEIDGDTARAVRRRRLVTDHEDVHVWQSRVFGPIYPVVYVGWIVVGGLAGAVRWGIKRDHSLGGSMDAWGYYANPFEWWAYSRDGNWPPNVLGDRASLVWKRPIVRSLVIARQTRAS